MYQVPVPDTRYQVPVLSSGQIEKGEEEEQAGAAHTNTLVLVLRGYNPPAPRYYIYSSLGWRRFATTL